MMIIKDLPYSLLLATFTVCAAPIFMGTLLAGLLVLALMLVGHGAVSWCRKLGQTIVWLCTEQARCVQELSTYKQRLNELHESAFSCRSELGGMGVDESLVIRARAYPLRYTHIWLRYQLLRMATFPRPIRMMIGPIATLLAYVVVWPLVILTYPFWSIMPVVRSHSVKGVLGEVLIDYFRSVLNIKDAAPSYSRETLDGLMKAFLDRYSRPAEAIASDEDNICSICQERCATLQESEAMQVGMIDSGVELHTDCFDRAWRQKRQCPNTRMAVSSHCRSPMQMQLSNGRVQVAPYCPITGEIFGLDQPIYFFPRARVFEGESRNSNGMPQRICFSQQGIDLLALRLKNSGVDRMMRIALLGPAVAVPKGTLMYRWLSAHCPADDLANGCVISPGECSTPRGGLWLQPARDISGWSKNLAIMIEFYLKPPNVQNGEGCQIYRETMRMKDQLDQQIVGTLDKATLAQMRRIVKLKLSEKSDRTDRGSERLQRYLSSLDGRLSTRIDEQHSCSQQVMPCG